MHSKKGMENKKGIVLVTCSQSRTASSTTARSTLILKATIDIRYLCSAVNIALRASFEACSRF